LLHLAKYLAALSRGKVIPMSAGLRNSIRASVFLRWFRFNLVGGIGIAVQLVLLFLLKSVLHFNYLAATAVAVEATVIHNFLWHERYTWADRVRPSWHNSLPRLLRFNLTNGAVSITGNLGLMKLMIDLGHMNYLVANAIAIALCSLVNFVVSDEYVFGGR
jgi:putative flippase GtrA